MFLVAQILNFHYNVSSQKKVTKQSSKSASTGPLEIWVCHATPGTPRDDTPALKINFIICAQIPNMFQLCCKVLLNASNSTTLFTFLKSALTSSTVLQSSLLYSFYLEKQ